jgi:hypothetical protein
MTVVNPLQHRRALISWVVLLLSVLACSVPVPTTVPAWTDTPTAVLSAMLTTPIAAMTTAPTLLVPQTAVIIRPVVRVHASPDSDVITGYLSAGDEVTILACEGDWCQIRTPAGFVFRGCLSDNPAGLGCRAK